MTPPDTRSVRHNLDYEATARSFKWDDVYPELDWLPGGGLNQAHEAIDRHAVGPRRHKTALVWVGRNGEREAYTFAQIKEQSDRFANVLRSLGIQKGDRVFLLLQRIPELYMAFFGILKTGAIAGPLFSGLGPEQVKDRLQHTGVKVLVTQPDLRESLATMVYELPELQHIVVVNKNRRDPRPTDPADLDYYDEMEKASPHSDTARTSQYDYSVINYTSGATGRPKCVVHCHMAVVQQYATGKWVLDLRDDDVCWCTADPGWATGTSYGILAPWTNAAEQVISEAGYHAGDWYQVIQDHKVSVWCTSEAAIRMLMAAGDALPRRYDLSSLRQVITVGEPLDAETIAWGASALRVPLHDTWWQTESGSIMIANYPDMAVRPGSMGKPTPGVHASIVDDDYNELGYGVTGNLAIRPGWPSMFRAYWNDAAMYHSRFRKGWYITGDRAHEDQDGYFWFAGRADDAANTD